MKASRHQPNWFHACEVFFVDAVDAHEAKRMVESDSELRVWSITPATPDMEARYRQWKADCDAWIERNRTGESNRGWVIRGF